jgi:hypothetical protein
MEATMRTANANYSETAIAFTDALIAAHACILDKQTWNEECKKTHAAYLIAERALIDIH